jgi:hypothetical protein
MNAAVILEERFAGIDAEAEQHIDDATYAYFYFYDKFREFGCPHDRDAALELLHTRDEALRSLPEHVKAARRAEFERELAEREGRCVL